MNTEIDSQSDQYGNGPAIQRRRTEFSLPDRCERRFVQSHPLAKRFLNPNSIHLPLRIDYCLDKGVPPECGLAMPVV